LIEKIDGVTFKITNRCNLYCQMCGYARNRAFEEKGEPELSLSQWQRVIDELVEMGINYFSILGGEPLLYPGLPEDQKYIAQKGKQCGITTNGLLLEENAQMLSEAGLHRIHISLDCFPEIHDAIRGTEGTFDRAMKGIKKIHRLKKGNQGPEIIANVVVSETNQDVLDKYLTHLSTQPELSKIYLIYGTFTTEKLGKAYSRELENNFGCPASSWEGFVRCLGNVDPKKIAGVYRNIQKGIYEKKIYTFPPLPKEEDIFTYYGEPGKQFQWVEERCWKPWYGMDFHADGSVAVCNDWPDYVIGNVKQQSVKQLWNGERIQKLRSYIGEDKEFSVCKRCPWRYLPNFIRADR
ncbi:MAG: radical SAM protein, partial [bacterium]|nr:radical SAM protein [bacterium]